MIHSTPQRIALWRRLLRVQWILLTFLFLSTAFLLAPLFFGELVVFDEGIIATGAMLIRRGALPVRDFYMIYGPGQYYFIAGIFHILGENLFWMRAFHVLCLALLGVVVVVVTAFTAPRRWAWAVLSALVYVSMTGVALPHAGYPSVLATLLLLAAGLAFATWAEAGARHWLGMASVFVGMVGVLRWDFGAYGLLAQALAVATVLGMRRAPIPTVVRGLALAVGPGLVLMAAAFAPFVFLGGAERWFNEVPRFLLVDFKTWRNLEFVGPALETAATAWTHGNRWFFSRAVATLTFAALPFAAALPALVIAGQRLVKTRGAVDRADALALVLGLTVLFLLNQMRVRPGFPQGLPAFVVSLPLAAYALSALPTDGGMRRFFHAALLGTLGAVLLIVPLYELQGDLRLALASVDSGFDLPRASHTRIRDLPATRQQWAEYVDLVRHVQQTTQDGEPVFSGVADTSRLHRNDALLYFLADRPPATRWMEMEPGLANTERGQRELIDELEHRWIRTVVLRQWTLDTEPNATARSSGVHLLDAYLRANFVQSRQFGSYVVMIRQPR
jgi:hypothetical protein